MKKGIFTTAIFVVLLLTGTVWSIAAKEKAFSDTENRYLKTRPKLTWKSYISGEFSEEYEEYVKDQFPMRNDFVALKNYCDMALFKSELKNILIGKDGYYIENHPQATYETELAISNARALAQFGVRVGRKLGSNHISIMIAPTAQTVMKGKLPYGAWVYDQGRYIDSMAAYAYEMEIRVDEMGDTDVNGMAAYADEAETKEGDENRTENRTEIAAMFLNVTEALMEHDGEYIYYRTDHHWTGLGAYYAYRYWTDIKGYPQYDIGDYEITKVTDDFLGTVNSKLNIYMKPDRIELWNMKNAEYDVTINLTEKKDSFYDMSFLDKKDKYSVFFGGNPGLVEIMRKTYDNIDGSTNSIGDNNANNSNGDSVRNSTDNSDYDNAYTDNATLLVIKDSYANCFVPIAAASFGHIYMVDLRYFNMNIDKFIDNYGITDVLVLYNADSAATDVYIKRLGD